MQGRVSKIQFAVLTLVLFIHAYLQLPYVASPGLCISLLHRRQRKIHRKPSAGIGCLKRQVPIVHFFIEQAFDVYNDILALDRVHLILDHVNAEIAALLMFRVTGNSASQA